MDHENLKKIIKIPLNLIKNIIYLWNKFFAYIQIIDPSQNTKKRIISSLIMIPIALIAIFHSQKLFFFLAVILAVLMAFEWSDISSKMPDQQKWRLYGVAYIAIPLYCAIAIRIIDEQILFWMFAIIWATDIFAFFAGRTLGGAKLAPNISPNKTWSGLLGGVVASFAIGLLSSLIFPGSILFFIAISVIISLIEQISDLFESKLKRIFGVKDSGNIIPGHGGVIDRLDGIILVAPFVYLLIKIFPTQFGLI